MKQFISGGIILIFYSCMCSIYFERVSRTILFKIVIHTNFVKCLFNLVYDFNQIMYSITM